MCAFTVCGGAYGHLLLAQIQIAYMETWIRMIKSKEYKLGVACKKEKRKNNIQGFPK